MKKLSLLSTLLFTIHHLLFSQSITQTIRGTVVDKETLRPLEGVTVAVKKDSTILGGTATDMQGEFRIANIPVGRVDVVVSFVGYKKVYISNLLLSSGKESVLTVEVESSVETMKDVVISGVKRGETINEMAVLSARAFSVEETDRYAGSRGDPARMASNFAGVSGTDDSRNDLVIRGNSPFGLLYRVDNIVIPNPSHFAVAGATGGSVAILNNRMLSNSDFLTGAFPGEFGNAISGVFDIRMKNGNNQRHEYTAQLGIMGAEIFGEGPFSKKSKSSYIFNARYATLEGLVKLGIDIGTEAIPKYEDLQFKMNFPLKNGDNLSLFAIGGYSQINFITSTRQKPEKRDIYASKDQDEYFRAGLGVLGLTYTHQVNDHEYSKVSFAVSTQYNKNHFDRVIRHVDSLTGNFVLDSMYRKLEYFFVNTRYTASFVRNNKVSSRSSVRYGLVTEGLQPVFVDSNLLEPQFEKGLANYTWQKRLDNRDGFHLLFQPYAQWKYAVNEKVSTVVGLHAQYFTLNHSWSVEPRFSVKYQFKPNQSLAFGTGLHSQLLPVYQYFIQDANGKQYNKNLDFMRSLHIVAGYDVFFKQDIRIKAEAYFQQLWGLPVDTFASSYNMLNEGSGFDRFFPGKLQSKGLGRNMGVEFTLEKFFTHNWFFMFSASLYDSRLQGSNGKYYNSDFNGNYILNALGTKEFKWGKKRLNTIGVGGKITFGGGQRYTPYDTLLSQQQTDPVVIDAERNTKQFKPYFRFDIKLNYRCNTKRYTHEVGIDLVNVAMYKNILRIQYVSPQEPAREVYQLGFLPLFYYRLDFWLGPKNW
ncbi:MAG TPA: TonB-dependent receptor [Chitinophagales bacterium]|nr:TonB-dependent receptor [Chitinophagales bacterium]